MSRRKVLPLSPDSSKPVAVRRVSMREFRRSLALIVRQNQPVIVRTYYQDVAVFLPTGAAVPGGRWDHAGWARQVRASARAAAETIAEES